MIQRIRFRTKAIIYVIVLAVLANFFLMPSQGVSDGIGGWPIGQIDTPPDTTTQALSSEPAPTTPSDPVSAPSLLSLL